MDPLRLGLIGAGVMGASHLTMEHGVVEEVRFTALCDVNEALLRAKSQELGVPGFADYHGLIDSGLCEAVLIATPHPFHEPAAVYAAERGLHVLSEKPLAVTVAQADRMLAAARAHGVLLGVMFQERTSALNRTAHRLVAAGTLGPVYRAELVASHWFRSKPYYDSGSWRGTWAGEGGGVLMNQAPHSLDLLLWLGGQPRAVTAQTFTRAHQIEVEDTVSALLDYGVGRTGYLYTTTAQWPGRLALHLYGELAQLSVEDGRLRLYRLARPLPESLREEPIFGQPAGAWEDVPLDAVEAPGHAAVVRAFARAVREGAPLVAEGTDGLRALELANALLLSGYTGQTVTLPLDRARYDDFLAAKVTASS